MQIRIAILLCGVLTVAHAENGCPWMNAATAGGLLGGTVSAKFLAGSKQGGKCEFTRAANPAASLRIEVAIMQSPGTQFARYHAKCSGDAKPLKAIGNEAVVCDSGHEQRVVGRVRDQVFILTLRPGDKQESIEKAAEIVAGNLF